MWRLCVLSFGKRSYLKHKYSRESRDVLGYKPKTTTSETEKTMAGEIPLYADLLVTHSKYLTSPTLHQKQTKVLLELL